jgi:heat shock protein HtpX
VYSNIAANKRKTVYMFIFFIALIGGLGWLVAQALGHPVLTPWILIGAAIYALITYYSGTKMALAVNGAKEIQKRDNPRYYRIVENLAITNGMPMPKLYIMDDPAPNAFATGRKPEKSAVCATTGLLEIMNDTELEGVMAHELGHIKNYDIRVSMYAFALVAVISLIADVILHYTFFSSSDSKNPYVYLLAIVAIVIAPVAASMIQMAISRQREYLADATGALTTRYPEGLASALEKIGQYGSALKKPNSSTAHLFFANPLSRGSLASLFSTHPPVTERVRILRSMGDKV